MPEISKGDQARLDAEAMLPDRRRPGRSHVNTVLVPLLRGRFSSEDASAEAPALIDASYLASLSEPETDLAGARGLLLGLAISLPLWAGIIFSARALLHLAF